MHIDSRNTADTKRRRHYPNGLVQLLRDWNLGRSNWSR
jgi:hypothetical protein